MKTTCKQIKTKTKKFPDFTKRKFVDFLNFMEIEFCWRLFFKIFTIHKPFLGSCEVPQKNVDVYWIHTDRQIDKQGIFMVLGHFIEKHFIDNNIINR